MMEIDRTRRVTIQIWTIPTGARNRETETEEAMETLASILEMACPRFTGATEYGFPEYGKMGDSLEEKSST